MTVTTKAPVLRAPFGDVGSLADSLAARAAEEAAKVAADQEAATSRHNGDHKTQRGRALAAITALAGGPVQR